MCTTTWRLHTFTQTRKASSHLIQHRAPTGGHAAAATALAACHAVGVLVRVLEGRGGLEMRLRLLGWRWRRGGEGLWGEAGAAGQRLAAEEAEILSGTGLSCFGEHFPQFL